MERELYRQLYRIVWPMGNRFHCPGTRHPTWRIVMVYFWAVLHDRPISWATQAHHWPTRTRLPSDATMSRRLRDARMIAMIHQVSLHIRKLLKPDPSVLMLDGKPLPIGGLGEDPDATVGYGAGKFCRGYKLHTMCDQHGVPVAWTVRSMREAEWKVAGDLVVLLPPGKGYIVADGNYDKTSLYDLTGPRNRHLIAPRRRGRDFGHRPQSPHRLRALSLDEALRQRLLSQRGAIERMFANLCNAGGALAPLGAWVRRQHRVELWVEAKMILYCLRMLLRRRNIAMEVA